MQKIRIDFDNPGLPQHISAVENDSQSRFFQATLYENGKAYTAPEGATYSIMYHGFGPQNQGWYDTINDGAGKRAACKVSGNVVTCEIARQALQVPGHVSIVLCVTTGKGYMLKSWPIECDCKNDRYDSTAEIQSFFYITQVSNEDWNRAIQALEELKNTIDPTLSLSGKAADAAKVGEAINAESERAKGVEGQLKEDLATEINRAKRNEESLDNKKADKTDLEIERKRIDVLNEGGLNIKDDVIDTSIKQWLNDHPEATTTVEDGAITEGKINAEFLPYIKNGYATPEMFGAVGDGVTDDTKAIQNTINYGASNKVNIEFGSKNYLCESSLTIPNGHTNIRGSDERRTILTFKGTDGIICEANTNGEKFFHMQNVMIKGNTGVGVRFVRMSHNVLLERCIIIGFQTGLYLEQCYVNDIKNTLIYDSTVYGIYMKNSTVISIYGGGINGKSGTNYYETSCFNNKLSQCDISAYQGSEVDYCVYVQNGFGSIYSFYYEGNYENNLPLIAGICFDTCICCSLVGGSVTNSGNKPAVKLLKYCKNVIIQDVYFYIGNEVKVGTVGISVEPTNYECVIKNCVFYGFEKSIDLKSDVRVVLESIESLSNNYGKINVVNSESVHLRLYNVKQDMLPTTITEVSSIDLQCVSLPYGKNWGNTGYKNEIEIKPAGFVYFNTNEQITQIWNGEQWIDLNGSSASKTYSVKGLNIDVIKRGKVVLVNVVGTLNDIISASGTVLCNSFSSVVNMENVFRCVTSDHFYSFVIKKSGDVILFPRNVLEIGDTIRCSFTYVSS